MRREIIIIIVLGILVLLAIYLFFFYSTKCSDENCFDRYLRNCKRATFINIQDEATWFYFVKGKSEDDCIVYVKALELSRVKEAQKLEGKDMICTLPLGAMTSPEAHLDMCHGLLKEAMQDLIIEKMHLYIVQNIGKISEELTRPI